MNKIINQSDCHMAPFYICHKQMLNRFLRLKTSNVRNYSTPWLTHVGKRTAPTPISWRESCDTDHNITLTDKWFDHMINARINIPDATNQINIAPLYSSDECAPTVLAPSDQEESRITVSISRLTRGLGKSHYFLRMPWYSAQTKLLLQETIKGISFTVHHSMEWWSHDWDVLSEHNKCMAMHLDAPPYHLPIFSNGLPIQMIKKKDLTHMALITHVNLDD